MGAFATCTARCCHLEVARSGPLPSLPPRFLQVWACSSCLQESPGALSMTRGGARSPHLPVRTPWGLSLWWVLHRSSHSQGSHLNTGVLRGDCSFCFLPGLPLSACSKHLGVGAPTISSGVGIPLRTYTGFVWEKQVNKPHGMGAESPKAFVLK